MTAEHRPDTEALKTIKLAVATLDELSPPDLVQALIQLSERYRVDAVELREAYQDKKAGKVWDIAAAGLEKTADEIQKCWATL